MPHIQPNNGVVTQITTVKVDAKNQPEVLQLMTERAKFMAAQPGFVSISLHRGADNNHIVNYVQWSSREQLKAVSDRRVDARRRQRRRLLSGRQRRPRRRAA